MKHGRWESSAIFLVKNNIEYLTEIYIIEVCVIGIIVYNNNVPRECNAVHCKSIDVGNDGYFAEYCMAAGIVPV